MQKIHSLNTHSTCDPDRLTAGYIPTFEDKAIDALAYTDARLGKMRYGKDWTSLDKAAYRFAFKQYRRI